MPHPRSKNSQLLYFQPEPHRSLYVEVDAVEGAEFSDSELSDLKSFLSQWCEKPDGVTVVKGDVIARSTARGQSADALARRYLNGPTVAPGADSPAYIYILVYDNRVNRQVLRSPRAASASPAAAAVPSKLAVQENPHVILYPYPGMIYMDRSWLGGLLPRKYWCASLAHETGHVLGLVSRQSQPGNPHCPTNWCLMNARVSTKIKSDLSDWFTRRGPRPVLCDACAAELRQFQTSTNRSSVRFVGPVLVRTAPLYHVLSLPQFCGLCIGDSLETSLPKFINSFRTAPRPPGPWMGYFIGGKLDDKESLLQAIEAAKQDGDPSVRAAARAAEKRLRGSGEKNVGKPDGG